MIALLLSAMLAGPPAPPVRTDYLRVEQTLPPLALAAALDLWVTGYRFRTTPDAIRELNWFGQSVEERAAISLAWVGAGVWVVHEVDRRWGRKWGIRVLVGVVAIKFGVSAWNYRVGN